MKTNERTKKLDEEKKFQTPKKENHQKENNLINILTKPQSVDKFPKNVNEFRHIMDDVNCCRADIEFMLELRRNKIIKKIEKISAFAEPHFYQDDLIKYKNKLIKKPEEKKLLQTNIGTFRQIFTDRTRYAINNSIYNYEVGLRTEPNRLSKSVDKISTKIPGGTDKQKNSILNRKSVQWDSTPIPKEKSLFDNLLPPILGFSKEIFSKNSNKICRPIIKVKKDGYINGEKIKSRIFEYHNLLAKRFPSDHIPSSRYVNDYGVQNIGEIRHLLDSDNRNMTSYWSTYLRGDKKTKILPEETKRREKRLKDKSNEKAYNKS